MGRWAIVFGLMALLTSCAGDLRVAGGTEPQQLPEPTAEPRWESIDEDHVRLWPRSAAIEPGIAYRLTVHTHCGLDHAFDLDGSFWTLVDDPPRGPEVLDDPDDTGIATLLGDGSVAYESSRGVIFRLERVDGAVERYLCE